MKNLLLSCWLLLAVSTCYGQPTDYLFSEKENTSKNDLPKFELNKKLKSESTNDEKALGGCYYGSELFVFPQPVDGYYQSGQTVEFCFHVFNWQPIGNEWFHSLQVVFGAGWDMNSLYPIPPDETVGGGVWSWYDSWVNCSTGEEFGPGFAYDSDQGVFCDGFPLDGVPGNNWGDEYLTTISSGQPGLTFCWLISVDECSGGQFFDLNQEVSIFSDATSGSFFDGIECYDNPPTIFGATKNCCLGDLSITTEVTNSTCSEPCDGVIEVSDLEVLPDATYDFFLHSADGITIDSCINCTSPYRVEDLCAGTYTVDSYRIQDVFCNTTTLVIEAENTSTSVEVIQSYPLSCAYETNLLEVEGGPFLAFEWTKEGVVIGAEPEITVEEAGTYRVEVVNALGCIQRGAIYIPEYTTPQITLYFGDTLDICAGSSPSTSVSSDLEISNVRWDVVDGPFLLLRPYESNTYTIYGDYEFEDGVICTVQEEVHIRVFNADLLGIQCQSIEGGVLYSWESISNINASIEAQVFEGNLGVLTDSTYTVLGMDVDAESKVLFKVTNQEINCFNSYVLACTAGDCPNTPIIDLLIPEEVCHEAIPFVLGVEIEGAIAGTSSWSGLGIIDEALGLFDPGVDDLPVESIIGYELVSDGCTTNVQSIIQLSNATITPEINCYSEGGVLTFEIEAFPNYNIHDFEVNILTGQTAEIYGRTIKFFNLSLGEEAVIEVVSYTSPNCTAVSQQNCFLGCEPFVSPEVTCLPIGADSLMFIWEEVPFQSYEVNVLTGQTGTQEVGQFIIDGLADGELVEIELHSSNICGDNFTAMAECNLGCPDLNILIPERTVCLNSSLTMSATIEGWNGQATLQWVGDCVVNEETGEIDVAACGLGIHDVTLIYTFGTCVYEQTAQFEVLSIPVFGFDVFPYELCIAQELEIYFDDQNGTLFPTWNVSGGGWVYSSGSSYSTYFNYPGFHEIELQVENSDGCMSEVFTNFVAVHDFYNLELSCEASASSITWSWADVPATNGYDYFLYLNGNLDAQGNIDENSFTVDNLDPGTVAELRLFPQDDIGCTSEEWSTCEVVDCPDISITIPSIVACLNSTLMMEATINGAPGGSFQWVGNCVTNEATGEIDVAACGVGVHDITLIYTLGTCEYQQTGQFEILDTPAVTFSLFLEELCIGELNTLDFDDQNGTLIPTWDFGGAVVVGTDPIELYWDFPGAIEISLYVTDISGCESSIYTQIVLVQDFDDLFMDCTSTLSSVSWSWNELLGVNEYAYTLILDGVMSEEGVITTNSFTVESLVPNTVAELIVIPQDGLGCSAEAFSICATEDCPSYTLDITTISIACISGDAIYLEVDLVGGNGELGTYQWEGAGIVDVSLGIFDPNIAGVGLHVITATYTELSCSYSSIISIEVIDEDELDVPTILSICDGSDFEFCLPDGNDYAWIGPNGFSSQNNCLVFFSSDIDIEGTYSLTVMSDAGCEMAYSIQVEVIENAIAFISGDEEVCPWELFEVSVDVPESAEVHWFPHEYVVCEDCPTTEAFTPSAVTYEVHVLDEWGCEWVDSVNVTIDVYCPFRPGRNNLLGGGEEAPGRFKSNDVGEQSLAMELFPNPVSSKLHIQWQGANEGEMTLYTIDGKRVKQHIVQNGTYELDCQGFTSGTYFIQLLFPNGVLTERVVVNN